MVLAHKDPFEIVPTADIDLVLIDADEVEALPLTGEFPRVRYRKYVFAHPDQRSDLGDDEAAFFG